MQDAEGRTFTFNGDDKQVKVKDVNQNVIGTYYYDGEGKRVKKVTNTETTVFVYDGGGDLAAEYSTAINQQPTTSYLTTDQVGSPRVITDKMGNVISRRDFMPFGEEIYAGVGPRTTVQKYSASGTDNIRKRFTGYEKDAETDLDFAEARMYQNRHGRFTAADPLLASIEQGNPQTFNRYIYTGNNPVNYTDPNGLKWVRDANYEVYWIPDDEDLNGRELVNGQRVIITSCDVECTNNSVNVGDTVILKANHTIELVLSPEQAQEAVDTAVQVVDTQVEILSTETTLGDHVVSALMTVAENNGGNIASNLLGLQPYNEHTQTGQNAGNAFTITQGTIQVVTGLTSAGGGGILTVVSSPLCVTVVGCAVPAGTATITAGGLITATHGASVVVNTLFNMGNNQGPGSRSGGSNTSQGPSSSVKDSTQAGSRVPNTDTDVTPLSAAKSLKKNGFESSRSKDGKALSFQKGDKKYSLRMKSKSTNGPTLDYSKGKEKVRKIRLNQ